MQLVFVRQPVVDGDCTAEAPPRQFQPGTAPQVQHGLIKNTAYNINVFAEIGKNFPRIFRRVLKGHDLEFNIGVQCLHSRPEIHQKLCGRHGGRADADDVFVLLHGVLRPRHRVAAILDDVSGVLIHGAPSFCQCQPPVAAVKKPDAKGFLQRIDLLDDRRGRDEALLRRLIEAPRVCYTQKSFQLWVIHGSSHLLVSSVCIIIYEMRFFRKPPLMLIFLIKLRHS